MALVFSKGDTTLADLISGTKQVYKTAYSQDFHTALNYFEYIRSGYSKYAPLTFEQSGNLMGLIFTPRLAWSHWESGTDAEFTVILQEDVGGTWTDRTQVTKRVSDWYRFITHPEEGKHSFQDPIYVEFDATYAIDTTANKWRFKIKNQRISGSDAAYVYLGKTGSGSLADDFMCVPVLAGTTTFDPSADVLFFKDVITSRDDNVDFNGMSTSGYGWYAAGFQAGRLALVPIVTEQSEVHSKLIILKPTVSEVTIGLGGNLVPTSSHFKREPSLQIGTEAEPITLDHKVNLLGYNHSSTYKAMFNTQYSFGYGQHRGFAFYGESGTHYRATLSGASQKGDTEIKVKGDYTDWEVGDNIHLTFGRYSIGYSYNDYRNQDVRKITNISYDAGTDETTIELDSALTYYYDLTDYGVNYAEVGIIITEADIDMWVYNIDKSAPIRIGAKDGDYCKTATHTNKLDEYSYMNSIECPSMEGILFMDYYRRHWRASYSRYRLQEDKKGYNWKDVFFWNNYYTIYDEYRPNIKGENISAFRSSMGTFYTHLRGVRNPNGHFKNGFAYGGSFGFYTASNFGMTIENYEMEANYIYYNASGSAGTVLKNNKFRKASVGVYWAGGADVTGYNNKWIYIDYRSSYSATTDTTMGMYLLNTATVASGESNFYNDDILYARAYVRVKADASINIYTENPTAQKIVTGRMFQATNEHKLMGTGSQIRYKNFLGDNIEQMISTEGISIQDDDGAGGLQWKLEPHDETFSYKYTKNSIITKNIVNKPFSVTVKLKINDASFYAGIHELPKITLRGQGISESQAIVTALPMTDWQFITVTGVPKTSGFVFVDIEFSSEGADKSIMVDDMISSPQDLRVSTDQNTTYRGQSLDTLFAETITPFNVWSADKDLDYGNNSFGKAVGLTYTWVNWLRSLL